MGKNSKISWTDHTWNPWRGCRKLSTGCAHCYMFREQARYGNNPAEIVRAADRTFLMPLLIKEPGKIFTCSWSDFFIEAADQWRENAWDIIRKTPHLTYLILTKRAHNIEERLPADWGPDGYKNVWLGTTIEEEQYLFRYYQLLSVPAAIHFVSAEPLLGPIDFEFTKEPGEKVDWVIVGGESGPAARAMNTDWAEDIREQCAASGIAFYYKQNGGTAYDRESGAHGGDMLNGKRYTAFPDPNRVREGKP